MKKKIRYAGWLLILVCLICLMSDDTAYAKTKYAFKKYPEKLCIGQTYNMKVSGATSKVTWKSSDTAKAAINKSGLLRAKKAGTVTITAKSGKQVIKCKIKMVQHNMKAATCTQPKTCTLCKKTQGKALGHAYTDATCTEAKICDRCKLIKGAALGHDYTKVTCTEDSVCTRCKDVAEKATGHSFDMTNGQLLGVKGDLKGIEYPCVKCNEKHLATGHDISLKTRLEYWSADGFTGENASTLNSIYRILKSIISESMSDEQKVKVIHDYLIYHANYYLGDLSSMPGWGYAAKGVIENGSGVCNSYALAFYIMATAEGIPCRFVGGTAGESADSVESHAWNRVLINGIWYYLDCTWDDPVSSDGRAGGYENHDYYLSTSLWSDHTATEEEDIVEDHIYYWENYYLCGQKW